MSGIKRTAADKWFSDYIRARDNWTCQRCGTKFKPYEEGGDNLGLKGLDNAHCFARGHNMTRFEPDNCMALCYGCHSYMDSNGEEKKEFFAERIGEERLQELRVMSKIPYKNVKRDQKDISERFRSLFREMLSAQQNKTHYNDL